MMHEIGPDAVQEAGKTGKPLSEFTGIEKGYNPVAEDVAGENVVTRMGGVDGAAEYGEKLFQTAGEDFAKLSSTASTAFEEEGALGVTRAMQSSSRLFGSMIKGAEAAGAAAESIGARIVTWLLRILVHLKN